MLNHPVVSVLYICDGAVLRTDNQCLTSLIYKGPFETCIKKRDRRQDSLCPFKQNCFVDCISSIKRNLNS